MKIYIRLVLKKIILLYSRRKKSCRMYKQSNTLICQSFESKKVYQTVFSAQEKAIEYIENQLNKKEQIQGTDVDKAARNYIISQGFGSFQHALGHGIGLEVHEPPRISPQSKYNLTEAMVFS